MHDDDDVILDNVPLLDEHLAEAGLLFIEESGNLYSGVPRDSLKVG